jgi:hypothetical protein
VGTPQLNLEIPQEGFSRTKRLPSTAEIDEELEMLKEAIDDGIRCVPSYFLLSIIKI